MLQSSVPVTSFAEEKDGLCEHHTEHTDCGYVEGTSACGYECQLCLQETEIITALEDTTELVETTESVETAEPVETTEPEETTQMEENTGTEATEEPEENPHDHLH